MKAKRLYGLSSKMECLPEANLQIYNKTAEILECSICLEAVTQQTGIYTSSCGHPFHLGCIARWVLKNENCPNCRNEFVSNERIVEAQGEGDSEYGFDDGDDFDESPDNDALIGEGLRWRRTESGRWVIFTGPEIPEFDPETHALWVMRTTFERAEEGIDLTVQPAVQPKNLVPRLDLSALSQIDRGYETE